MKRKSLLAIALASATLSGCSIVGGIVGVVVVGAVLVGVGQMVVLEWGPVTESWPAQPADADTAKILALGKQTAERRISLDITASGTWVDNQFGGSNMRVRMMWKKPDRLRLDVFSEPTEAGGPVVIKEIYLRPNANEWRLYDNAAKVLTILDYRNAEKSVNELRVLRVEPMPWFFRTGADVARRRWKMEFLGPGERGDLFRLSPANDGWAREGEIEIDPRNGMPTRIAMRHQWVDSTLPMKELVVESHQEDATLDDAVFEPWMPKPEEGWTIQRQDMGVKEDAEAVIKRANETDRAVVRK